MNQRTGPLPTSGTFTTTAQGTIVITGFGSAWTNARWSNVGMTISLDGAAVGESKVAANETGVHFAFVPNAIVVVAVAPGTHTVSLAPLNSTTNTDVNDFFSVTVEELTSPAA